jgi:transcription elongation GreA/GreB family factor
MLKYKNKFKMRQIAMAKREFKNKRIKEIVKNIADDFRFSQDMGEYALLFYKADGDGMISGGQIEKMLEYVTTGLEELSKNIQWREEFLQENVGLDEIRMLQNMKTIEEEYSELRDFLKK